MIEVINKQRKFKIDSEVWRNFAMQVSKTVPQANDKAFTIVFVSDKKMRELNETFRQKDATTDVLSFPNERDEFDFDDTANFLGEIVISVAQAEKQSKENGLTLELEIKQLILHGVLHLCDYDHATDDGEMNRIEMKYREKLFIN